MWSSLAQFLLDVLSFRNIAQQSFENVNISYLGLTLELHKRSLFFPMLILHAKKLISLVISLDCILQFLTELSLSIW